MAQILKLNQMKILSLNQMKILSLIQMMMRIPMILTQMTETMMMIPRAKARTSLSNLMTTLRSIRPLSESFFSDDLPMKQAKKFKLFVCNKLLGACVLVLSYLAFTYIVM